MIVNAIRLITFLYVALIIGVVVSAGKGWYPEVFAWVQEGATDKWMHFLLVGLLTFLVDLSLRCKIIGKGLISIQIGTFALFTLTTIEEFSQMLIPRRTFDWNDLLCNWAGIICFGLLAWIVGSLMGIKKQDSTHVITHSPSQT